MTLRERLGLPATVSASTAITPILRATETCACRYPERHYNGTPCTYSPDEPGNVPLGPEGYCWSCWGAGHDKEPAPAKPAYMRYLDRKREEAGGRIEALHEISG